MENEEKLKNIEVETYAEDMTKAIESIGMNEGGFLKKIIHEQETNDIKKENLSPESKRNKLFMSTGFILMLLAIVFVVSAIALRKQISTVPVAPQYAPIIFTDQNKFLEIADLQKDKIAQSILEYVDTTKVKNGGIEAIYLTKNKKFVGFREFLTSIEANVDQSQLTYLEDNFLVGITNLENKNLFVLLKMRSVPDMFSNMHSWENKMFFDLHGFFGVDITPETKYLLTKDFEDGIVQNKNARILRDNDGKIIIMYVYANDTSIVVTNSESSASEVMVRLAASQVKK